MFKSTTELKEYLKQFASTENYSYLDAHAEHFLKSCEIIASYCDRSHPQTFVDIGSKDGVFVPAINHISTLSDIHIIDYGERGSENVELESITEKVALQRHYLNIEKDALPFADESIDLVIFLETLEHLLYDPMYVLLQINRVLKPGGFLLISTPNINSANSFKQMLQGKNPNYFTPYKEPENVYGRHNREFTIEEVKTLANKSGFAVDRVITHPITGKKIKLFFQVLNLLGLSQVKTDELGMFTYIACKKQQQMNIAKMDSATRYPKPIYRMLKQ